MITCIETVKSSSRATVKCRHIRKCLPDCIKQFEGERRGPLNKGMNGHLDNWRHSMLESLPTTEQFCSANHDFLHHALNTVKSGQILTGMSCRCYRSLILLRDAMCWSVLCDCNIPGHTHIL